MSITYNNFHPQAYLTYIMHTGRPMLKGATLETPSDGAAVHKAVGIYPPESVMSVIYNDSEPTGNASIKANFFNLPPHKITALVPEVKLYKMENDVKIPFYIPVAAINPEGPTLGGTALRTFSLKHIGTNPFEAPRYLESSIQIFVDSMANFFAEPPAGYSRLADLFTVSVPNPVSFQNRDAGPVPAGIINRNIQVGVSIGYKISVSDRELFTPGEISEIESANLFVRMNVVEHTINVNQDGSATVDISYTAWLDQSLREKTYSILDDPIDTLRRADIKALKDQAAQAKDSNETKTKQEDNKIESTRRSRGDKIRSLRKIAENLHNKRKIHDVATVAIDTKKGKVLSSALGEYKIFGQSNPDGRPAAPTGPAAATGASPVPTSESGRGKMAKDIKTMIDRLDLSERSVYYVTLGDMIQAFFDVTKENLAAASKIVNQSKKVEDGGWDGFMQLSLDRRNAIKEAITNALESLKTFRVLLPDIQFKLKSTGGAQKPQERINLADLPVSIELYQKFMYQQVVNSHKNTYTIPTFLEDLVTFLNEQLFDGWTENHVAPNILESKALFSSATFTGPQLKASLRRSPEVPAGEVEGPNSYSPDSIDKAHDYFVIYQKHEAATATEQKGDESLDRTKGIYHFHLGKDRGLVKQINFSRFDVEGMKEQLMTNQVGLYDELKIPYTATITMFGNNLFFPGNQIFIDPSSIGFGNPRDQSSAAFQLGIGGYYTVLTVATNYSSGEMETVLECSFGSPASSTEFTSHLKNDFSRQAANQLFPQETGQVTQMRPPPEQDFSVTGESMYTQRIMALNTSDDELVVTEQVAQAISRDFSSEQRSNTNSYVLGVKSKSFSIATNSARYLLKNTNLAIVIDPVGQIVRLERDVI